jgi:prepilin-type N-terminal cleavage/methylation domain-containing protein
MLQHTHRSHQRGFTLVEIMIVVAIIAIIAAIATPNFMRARKRSQATITLETLRNIEAAIDQYAIDNKKGAGDPVDWSDVQPYLKQGTPIYNSGGKDLFGNAFSPLQVDQPPQVADATFSKLEDVADASFWGPYYANNSSSSSGSGGGSAPMTQQQMADGLGAIQAFDDFISHGGDPNSSQGQALLAPAQSAAQALASQTGNMNPSMQGAYNNAITDNYNNGTANVHDLLFPH